jgi:hypothetical protein
LISIETTAVGTSYLFRCNHCGYAVESSGQLDFGMLAVVEPYICSDCKELTDVLVGVRGEVFPFDKLSAKQKRELYRCDKCKSRKIEKWDAQKQSCPKCGKRMKKDDTPTMSWD